jgi:hypothetical protein
MHPLAAKLFHKDIRMFLIGKTENTVPLPLPNNGWPCTSPQQGRPRMGNFPPLLALCAFGDATLAHQPVALCAQLIDLGLHPGQQLFRGLGWKACPLKVPNFSPLPQDLTAADVHFLPGCMRCALTSSSTVHRT